MAQNNSFGAFKIHTTNTLLLLHGKHGWHDLMVTFASAQDFNGALKKTINNNKIRCI